MCVFGAFHISTGEGNEFMIPVNALMFLPVLLINEKGTSLCCLVTDGYHPWLPQ